MIQTLLPSLDQANSDLCHWYVENAILPWRNIHPLFVSIKLKAVVCSNCIIPTPCDSTIFDTFAQSMLQLWKSSFKPF